MRLRSLRPDGTNGTLIGMVRDVELRSSLQQALAGFPVRAIEAPEGSHAAVAVAVVDEGHGSTVEGLGLIERWSERPALLLTRRSARLANHPGQWALPGGRLDSGETPEQAALREMSEEVGVEVAEQDVLGRLDDYATRSGFVITPVVVWAGAAKRVVPNPGEVEEVHRFNFDEFLRKDAPLFDPGEQPDRPVLRMPIGEDSIAAPTAAVLYQFREVCLLGQQTRVAHFDQPRFAWR